MARRHQRSACSPSRVSAPLRHPVSFWMTSAPSQLAIDSPRPHFRAVRHFNLEILPAGSAWDSPLTSWRIPTTTMS